MKILFLGVCISKELLLSLKTEHQNEINASYSAIKYGASILDGLHKTNINNVTNLCLVPFGMYPSSKTLHWFKINCNSYKYIPFINIIGIKQGMISIYAFLFTLKWYFSQQRTEQKVVITSFIYLPFLFAIWPFKLFKNFHIVSFVPDIPDYEFSYTKNKNKLKALFIPLYIKLSKKIVSISDYFIFITLQMAERFAPRPYVIIEGFTNNDLMQITDVDATEKKAIMYAGGMFEKFGIRLLLDSFIKITGDYELWLFGSGDMENSIATYIKLDPRIKYFGNRPNNEVIKYQMSAKLLINPRTSTDVFTRFSFPSKILEYMCSGTPILCTKLLGIPTDYNDKIYFIDDESVNGFVGAINKCLSKSTNELNAFGKNAKQYALISKNNVFQIKKLLIDIEAKLFKYNNK